MNRPGPARRPLSHRHIERAWQRYPVRCGLGMLLALITLPWLGELSLMVFVFCLTLLLGLMRARSLSRTDPADAVARDSAASPPPQQKGA